MNVRALVAIGCVLGAGVAVVWPPAAVRVEAVLLALMAGGLVLEGLQRALWGVDAVVPPPQGVPAPPPALFVAADLEELLVDLGAVPSARRRRLPGSRAIRPASDVDLPIPDVVYSRLQHVAHRRVQQRLGLDPSDPGTHAALAAAVPPALCELVLRGLVVDPTSNRLRRDYVFESQRPPIRALPTLLDQLESL